MEFLQPLLSILSANSTLVFILTVLGAALASATVILDYRNERRARDNFGVERRRLSEVNLKVEHNVRLVLARQKRPVSASGQQQGEQKQGAFMVLRMPLENIGDGPIDILGMLASARQLTYTEWENGIGARSRDVEWNDYHASYWNREDLSHSVFAGISTTKSLVNAADNFTRLAAKEYGAMRRLDAVVSMPTLREVKTIHVMYRVFAVARGYALGEILRQLGGGPPDPATNVRQELLQFQRLAQPNYRRWIAVQKALINLNRFAFRLAIFDLHNPSASEDPLGVLVTPDAWRIFLLHHWEFIDEGASAAPKGLPAKYEKPFRLPVGALERASAIAERYFPHRRLPDTWDEETKRTIHEAHEQCARELAPFVAAWQRLQAAIKRCEENDFSARVPRNCPNEGYPRMIHSVPEYKARWFALMQEGYLVSKPFQRSRINVGFIHTGGRHRNLGMADIPDDPRALEPFVMRTYYFLDSLDMRELTNEHRAVDEDGASGVRKD
jgi:hypothetical protein